MKTDLDILIEHMQDEVDGLRSAMDKCVLEWNFLGAEAIKKQLSLSIGKLTTAKTLKKPNHKKISRLQSQIKNTKKSLERDLENYNPLFSESLQKPLKKFIREGISRKLKDDVAKLEKLKLEIFDSRPDNDKVIELIESLRGNHIQKIQFEIIQEQVYLELRIDNSKAKLNFKTINEKELNQSLHRSTLNILKTIGFDNENELTISIRANTDSQKLLSILSIVIFEAFNYLELREMNLIVFA